MTPESTTAETTTPGASAAGAPSAASGSRRPITEADLLKFAWIADPQIAPDGSRIAFTRIEVDTENDDYRTSLWIVDAAGDAPPRALTTGTKDSQPRWSPDGARIAFVRVAEKEKPGQIFVLPMAGGEPVALTSLTKGAANPAWSPDGKRIAFSSDTNPAIDTPDFKPPKREPARVVTRPVFRENAVGFFDFERMSHVWVVDAAGGTPRQLTAGAFADGAPRWSLGGERILFVSDRRPEPWFGLADAKLYAVDPDRAEPADTAALEAITAFAGPIGEFVEAADGRIVAIGSIAPAAARSYDPPDVLLLEGAWPIAGPRTLNHDDRYAWGEGINSDQHPPRGGGSLPLAFAPGGNAILAQAASEGASMLVRLDLATGVTHELTPRRHDVYSGTVSRDGARWALAVGSLDRPGDLYVLDAATGALTKRFGPNDEWLDGVTLGAVEELAIDSFDGERLQGWLVTPPDFDPAKQYPLVLEIHGGPHTAYGVGFFHEFQVLAGAGFVVLYVNPRGSTSYGDRFANCIQYDFPGVDAKDLLAAVDHVVARGFVDPKRLGVTGGSGGGLLTNWLVTQTDRFAAACTQRCVSEWSSMMGTCDFAMFREHWFRGQPHEAAKEYAERSPWTYVDRIRTPLMIIHSEEDWRTPIGQGELMFRSLKYLKRPVVMVRFPGENHELSRSGMPSHRVQNQEHIRRWFDHWLQGKRTDAYGV